MTLSVFAAGTSGPPMTGAEYRPGVCNIGRAEIDRRRGAGHVGLILTVVVLAILVVVGAPPLLRLLLLLPAGAAASGYLQAWFKFCAGFASRGVFNFGPVGEIHEVGDAEARARDRSKANRIGLASLGIGLGVAVAAVLLPI